MFLWHAHLSVSPLGTGCPIEGSHLPCGLSPHGPLPATAQGPPAFLPLQPLGQHFYLIITELSYLKIIFIKKTTKTKDI